MAKQIQIRRGTTAAHKNFTGAPGEITVDTDKNTLCVHDGKTPGGTPLARAADIPGTKSIAADIADYVIEYQRPDATNNYTWYRKYKSGWIEQGGHTAQSPDTITQITPPVKMLDNNHTILTTATTDAAEQTWYACGFIE